MYISKSQREDFKTQLKESLDSLMYRVEWEKAGVEDMTYIKAIDFSDAMKKFKERFPQVEEKDIIAFVRENNPIKEEVEDDVKVEVDGEVVADTSEENKEEVEVPSTDTSMGASQIINSLIQDELQAIDGYNSAIQTFRSMAEVDDKEKLEKCIKVLSDIASEENIHVGQLQEVQKLFNDQATLVTDGVEEAKEQIEEAPVEEVKEEVVESVESATQTLKDKYKDPEAKSLIDAIISLLEEHSPEQAERIKEIVKD